MDKAFSNGELNAIVLKLEQTSKDINLPPKIAYKIVKNNLAIKQALQPYQLTRNEIIKKITGGKDRVSFADDPDKFNEVAAAIGDIDRETVAVNIDTIKFDDLPDESMPLAFIDAINFMIEE